MKQEIKHVIRIYPQSQFSETRIVKSLNEIYSLIGKLFEFNKGNGFYQINLFQDTLDYFKSEVIPYIAETANFAVSYNPLERLGE